MKLWIDDERPAPASWDGDIVTCTNSEAAIWFLERCVLPGPDGVPYLALEEISLDHDLGGDDTTRPVVMWMTERNLWPRVCRVHTANPVGREWLEGMIHRYGPGVTR